MPRRPVYPPFVYSGGQWPMQLGPYAQYAPPYPMGYGQYQPYYGPPAYAVPSPRQRNDRRRHSGSLAPEIQVHPLLEGRGRQSVLWDVSQDPITARYPTSRGAMEKIPASLLQEPATEPPIHRMRILSDFSWHINIELPRGQAVTVAHILGAIYGTLQEPIEREEWDLETPNGKRFLHRARCTRLAKGEVSFKLDGHLKKVDTVGEKTGFKGITLASSPEDPVEWLLHLVPQPKPGRR